MQARPLYIGLGGAIIGIVILAALAWWLFDNRLEFDVVNETSGDVTIEVIGGAHWDARPENARVYYQRVVESGDHDLLVVDKPREDWTLFIDGRPVTDASEWPHDNPQIDLTLRVQADGSVSVTDT